MASAVYPEALEGFGNADIDWLAHEIRLILVDAADYTYSATHTFLSSVPAGARVATSGALTGKTNTNGTLDADDVTLTAVTGDPSEAIIIYDHDGGADAARRLIAYIDNYSGLPVTPNGSNIEIRFPAGGILTI